MCNAVAGCSAHMLTYHGFLCHVLCMLFYVVQYYSTDIFFTTTINATCCIVSKYLYLACHGLGHGCFSSCRCDACPQTLFYLLATIKGALALYVAALVTSSSSRYLILMATVSAVQRRCDRRRLKVCSCSCHHQKCPLPNYRYRMLSFYLRCAFVSQASAAVKAKAHTASR